jgi:transcriptional repressor NrdR
MRCPFCSGTDNRVVDSRVSREGRAVRRRRECLECHRRFTTYEYVEERPLLIVKRDATTERYDRRKVVQSMQLACAKRPVPADTIEAMADEVEDALSRRGDDEVPSLVVGELIMDRLKGRDHVAYVRYASVYRNFQDLEEFYEELRDLSARRARAAMSEGQAELPFSESS